ncbi:5-hydroxytryptamine receptor 3A-like [Seriola lalandi dorsalis]|uniref:5-hydroxytryptamine receptor 3A-like n=1 Tax=Seriola lalandi dorsalis TaxID=1841481 RepID=UPI000C6F6C31|nr:5-hydroxytryptamine receptor 3A-like [Seriola lalandi dorsalis]
MVPLGFFLLLLTAVDGESSERVCGYQDVLNYLNLTKDNVFYFATRPVKDHTQPTVVYLDVLLNAILDVVKIDQIFIPYIWITMHWNNQHILWNASEFCGISSVSIPAEFLWKPDLKIKETTENASPSPRLTVMNDGEVFLLNDQAFVSSCRMQVYKFPFDIQTCTLSFSSVVYSDTELELSHSMSSSDTTEWSHEMMQTQYEWLFIDMTVTNKTVERFSWTKDVIIYTIKMKRRSALYIINFIVPILFFLCLDLASFLISDHGGEKLSFKVTVLLAVTVMQLILNEILPSSSNRIPLIAVYCLGIFGLMLLSLLETVFIMYLLDRDSASQESETDEDQRLSEDHGDKRGKGNSHDCEGEEKKWSQCLCVHDVSADETPTELLKVSSSQLSDVSQGFDKLSDDVREVVRTLNLILHNRKKEGKPAGYWARKTKTINKIFFIFYATACTLFLVCMFSNW